MAGKQDSRMVEAMKLVLAKTHSPYAAAQQVGLGKCSIYRSRIYKLWHSGDIEGAKRLMEAPVAAPRTKKAQTNIEQGCAKSPANAC